MVVRIVETLLTYIVAPTIVCSHRKLQLVLCFFFFSIVRVGLLVYI